MDINIDVAQKQKYEVAEFTFFQWYREQVRRGALNV